MGIVVTFEIVICCSQATYRRATMCTSVKSAQRALALTLRLRTNTVRLSCAGADSRRFLPGSSTSCDPLQASSRSFCSRMAPTKGLLFRQVGLPSPVRPRRSKHVCKPLVCFVTLKSACINLLNLHYEIFTGSVSVLYLNICRAVAAS